MCGRRAGSVVMVSGNHAGEEKILAACLGVPEEANRVQQKATRQTLRRFDMGTNRGLEVHTVLGSLRSRCRDPNQKETDGAEAGQAGGAPLHCGAPRLFGDVDPLSPPHRWPRPSLREPAHMHGKGLQPAPAAMGEIDTSPLVYRGTEE